jgi:phosphohistidine phosphatase
MQIYLLRHGIAEDVSASGRDADRQLTAEGRKRLASILKRAAGAGVEPSLILSSPLIRARQTAEIAAKTLGGTHQIVQTKVLEPGGEPELVWEELRARRAEPRVLLCGHEPLFGRLAAYLLSSAALEIDFKKGALLRIDCESLGPRPRGTLKWFLPPKLA